MKESSFRLHIRRKFFAMKVVRHWNRLLRETANVPVLEVFEARLDVAQSNLVNGRCPCRQQGVGIRLNLRSLPTHSMIP